MHRVLFRRHARLSLVSVSHRFAQGGLVLLGLAICGSLDVIFGLVVNAVTGWVAAAVGIAVSAGPSTLIPRLHLLAEWGERIHQAYRFRRQDRRGATARLRYAPLHFVKFGTEEGTLQCRIRVR